MILLSSPEGLKEGQVIVAATQGYDSLDPEDEFKIIEIPISHGYARAPQPFLSLTPQKSRR